MMEPRQIHLDQQDSMSQDPLSALASVRAGSHLGSQALATTSTLFPGKSIEIDYTLPITLPPGTVFTSEFTASSHVIIQDGNVSGQGTISLSFQFPDGSSRIVFSDTVEAAPVIERSEQNSPLKAA